MRRPKIAGQEKALEKRHMGRQFAAPSEAGRSSNYEYSNWLARAHICLGVLPYSRQTLVCVSEIALSTLGTTSPIGLLGLLPAYLTLATSCPKSSDRIPSDTIIRTCSITARSLCAQGVSENYWNVKATFAQAQSYAVLFTG